MKRSRLLSFALCAGLAACADEVAPTSNTTTTTAALDERIELASAQPGYFSVRRTVGDAIYVVRVDGAPTLCGDRAPHTDCRVGVLDLGRLDTLPEDEAWLRSRAPELGAVVWYGKLIKTQELGDELVVTQAWVQRAVSASLAKTVPSSLHVLRDVHEGCAAAEGCAWLRTEPIDGRRAVHDAQMDMLLLDRTLDDATKAAIARGEVLAVGLNAGTSFIPGALYTPWNVVIAGGSVPVR